MTHRILVADDDPGIREVLAYALDREGMEVIESRDGAEALAAATGQSPDLVILDIGMPEMDGLDVCRELRRTSQVPVLFLTARDDEIDRILGLEIGGDDYVTKPFSPREVAARVKVILRRAQAPAPPPPEILEHGALRLDPEAHLLTVDGQQVKTTALEMQILRTLLERPTKVFTRAEIVDSAWPDGLHVSDRTVDSHIRNLRAKLGRCEGVQTVHGVGFRAGSGRMTS